MRIRRQRLQAYAQQFQPDVVVVVIDLQMSYPRWPALEPDLPINDQAVHKLSWSEALIKRAAQYSALFSILDHAVDVRMWVQSTTHLALSETASEPQTAQPADAIQNNPGTLAATAPDQLDAYEQAREIDLSAPIAALAAYSQERGFRLYLVTPYGPYFRSTDDALKNFSMNNLPEFQHAVHVYGGIGAAFRGETLLVTRIIHKAAAKYQINVIDMSHESQMAVMGDPRESDFYDDGIHLSGKGNVRIGQMIADRLVSDRSLNGASAVP